MIHCLKKIGVMLVGLIPAVFHYFVTSPLLWSHQSSAAFEMNLLLWIVALCLFIWSCNYEPSATVDRKADSK